jgi:predicted enzyme related to lactoylglutathione lyase
MTQPASNRITWFEIPVTDMNRASKFYGEILGESLEPGPGMDGFLMTMFPPTSGVNGALVQGETYMPSGQGAVVYLNGGDDLTTVLNRVDGAGGKALSEKIDIGEGNGFCAYFEDTEGNRIGLHSVG